MSTKVIDERKSALAEVCLKQKIICESAAFKPKEVYVEVAHYIYWFVKA